MHRGFWKVKIGRILRLIRSRAKQRLGVDVLPLLQMCSLSRSESGLTNMSFCQVKLLVKSRVYQVSLTRQLGSRPVICSWAQTSAQRSPILRGYQGSGSRDRYGHLVFRSCSRA